MCWLLTVNQRPEACRASVITPVLDDRTCGECIPDPGMPNIIGIWQKKPGLKFSFPPQLRGGEPVQIIRLCTSLRRMGLVRSRLKLCCWLPACANGRVTHA